MLVSSPGRHALSKTQSACPYLFASDRASPSLGPSATAVIAQLAARRSHNPKVVSSILTHRIYRIHKGRLSPRPQS